MDRLAKKILMHCEPTLEKMLTSGISERELENTYKMICVAKDLLECDVAMAKIQKMKKDGEFHDIDDDSMSANGLPVNPKKY